MFKMLRQKIEESDTVKKANDSLLGKYLSPGQQSDPASGGAESPTSSASAVGGSSGVGRYGAAPQAVTTSRSRQSSVGSAVSEASSSTATGAAGIEASSVSATSSLESMSRPELVQRLQHAQSLARRYKARLFEADNRLRGGECDGAMLARLDARDRLIVALKLQSSLLIEGRPVPAELDSEVRQADLSVSAADFAESSVEPADADSVQRPNGDGRTVVGQSTGDHETFEKQRQRIFQLEAEAQTLKEQLTVKMAELERQHQQLLQLRQTAETAADDSSSDHVAATDALKSRLREAESKLALAEQRHRDERAIAAEEAASDRRRLKQQLAELQQQLAAREREAALKDSTGATRESEIRTLKERLDSRLASERRLREEAKARSAEATSLAEQLRASRLEAESLARQCREQRHQLEAGLAGQLEQLETEQADRLKAAAREFQDRLDAKERAFQAKFQEAVERFQEADSRARAAHRLETDELLQGLEACEVAEGRLNRRFEAAESERAAAVAELTACQAAAAEDVERLRADAADAEAGRLAAEVVAEELRAQLEAAAVAAPVADGGIGGSVGANREAIRSAAAAAPSSSALLLNSLAERVDRVRTAAVCGRHTGDSVSLEDYEAVKMYAADLQKQLMSVNSELAELRHRAPQPSPSPVSQESANSQYQFSAFTEIPEVEYLRNVLYKYMLGEKTQTLARVICTVLKFTDYQIQQVMDHEGKRAAMHVVQ